MLLAGRDETAMTAIVREQRASSAPRSLAALWPALAWAHTE